MDLRIKKASPTGVVTISHSRVRQLRDGWWILVDDHFGRPIVEEHRGPFTSKADAEYAQATPIVEAVETSTLLETTAAGRHLLAKGRKRSRRSTPR